jgi:hypothetical protein
MKTIEVTTGGSSSGEVALLSPVNGGRSHSRPVSEMVLPGQSAAGLTSRPPRR